MSAAGDIKRYMVVERFKPGAFDAVYARFAASGRLLPDGLVFIDSWVSSERDICWQVMETADPKTFDAWTARWSDLVDFEIVPLMRRPNG